MGKKTQKDEAELADKDAEKIEIMPEENPDPQETKAEEMSTEEVTDATLGEALKKLVDAEEVASRANDDLLRVQAEMQNLRRRSEQDIEKAHKYSQEKFSLSLIHI